MRIVIDARMLYWTGVGRYTKALLEHLPELDAQNDYLVLTRPADRVLWEPAAPNIKRIEVAIDPYSLDEQFGLGKIISELKPDLVHFTTPNIPAYQGRYVVTVHDLTLLDYDTSRGTGWQKAVHGLKRIPFRWVFRRAVTHATGITTGTKYVQQQLIERFGVPKARLTVAPLAADPLLAEPVSTKRLGVKPPYLLYVNNFYPYKNAGSVLLALKELVTTHPDLQLVFTGKPDYFRDVLESQAAELGLADRVVFTGFVTDGELITLYREAALFIYPSLSEGFGLQGLEAMAQGTPVLAARASCLPEVYGEAAAYFDPHNPSDQARQIAEVLQSDIQRKALRASGYERVKQFSWKRTAEQTLAAYRQALK